MASILPRPQCVNSHFNYCPLVWHFCEKNGDKREISQERALRIIYRNYDSTYTQLLREAGAYTIFDKRLHSMVLHVFKSRKSLNAKYLNDTFSVKQINYSMRQVLKWVQPQRKTTTVGLKKSNIWEPSCGMTVLYYVKNCGQRTFLHLNALSMTQSEMSSHMTIFSIHENPHMPLLFLFFF